MLEHNSKHSGNDKCPVFIADKCLQCGVCLSVCPVGALSKAQKGNKYHIVVDSEKCIGCKKCSQYCPSHYIVKDRVNFDRIREGSCFISYAKDKSVGYSSSSGGTVRAIVSNFLKADSRHRVYTLVTCGNGVKGNLISEAELDLMPNSIYAPTMWGENLHQIHQRCNSFDSLLVIGLPCQIKAAQRVIATYRLQADVRFIAIMCRKTKDFRLGNYIRKSHRLKKEEPMIFRGNGWPGKIGSPYDESRQSDYSSFSAIPFGLDIWNVKGCYRCADCLAQDCADITVGDPWGMKEANSNGCNILFVNSPKGEELIRESSAALFFIAISKGKAETVADKGLLTNKVNRLRFYTGLDKGIKTRLKYFLLDSKSDLYGIIISKIGHTRIGRSIGKILLKVDGLVKKLLA